MESLLGSEGARKQEILYDHCERSISMVLESAVESLLGS